MSFRGSIVVVAVVAVVGCQMSLKGSIVGKQLVTFVAFHSYLPSSGGSSSSSSSSKAGTWR